MSHVLGGQGHRHFQAMFGSERMHVWETPKREPIVLRADGEEGAMKNMPISHGHTMSYL